MLPILFVSIDQFGRHKFTTGSQTDFKTMNYL